MALHHLIKKQTLIIGVVVVKRRVVVGIIFVEITLIILLLDLF